MQTVHPRLTLNVCARCHSWLSTSRSFSRARPSLKRSLSTASTAKPLNFTSYFFHNERWTSEPYHSDAIVSPSVAIPPPPRMSYPPPTVPLTAYKDVPALTPSRLLTVYSQLSKSRLSVLVVLTAMSGVALSPLHASVPVLLSTALGTMLCSASANTLNQIQEIPFDAQMARTRNRPLVRRAISPVHAAGFAVATGISGGALLWTMVNPITAILGVSNIALYAGLYTWMKRRTIWNTWVGAVVGALPPLMGWTACGGQLLPSASYPIATFLPSFLSASSVPDLMAIDNPLAAFALFMLLFSWQFPHFNALSHLVRGSYAQAGYRMLSVLSPSKNALVALRHAVLMTGICSVLIPLSGLTTWAFALTSLVPKRGLRQRSVEILEVGRGEAGEDRVPSQPVGMDWGKWLGITEDDEDEDLQGSQL
ncbi:hypothetical protein EVG20_g963 [Dentipellis fragilis]|uniref:Protoheme IX farnesyltransferase, mitochondrial n=1 Tax=Dentipellis fragilis TaxID=205917 RepID=A0A4Y9ZB54_9AGAM|nr:hypothetical protein EVG20_g963 [Dentipellis fragilis]